MPECLIEWNEGEPKRPGWYDCLIDDEYEDRLYWWICQINPRRRVWKDRAGNYMNQHKVKWTGRPEANP